jgi:hypothetical protein
MKSLFEKEEKETAINQIKVNLISRYFPLEKDEVLKYKAILNFDRYHLLSNEYIKWDNEQLESLSDKIDWTAIWKIKNIILDFEFFEKYEKKIDFSTIHNSNSIIWTNKLLAQFGDKFNWSKTLILKEPLSTIDNLRRFQDKIDWSLVSQRININFSESAIEEFTEKWDWKKLSLNENLPISVDFIQKHIDQLDFDALSENPKCIELIYKYPTSKKWNWNKVILNSAIKYDKFSFEFLFGHFKKQNEGNAYSNSYLKLFALELFLSLVFSKPRNDIRYFLNDNFEKKLPWKNIYKFCNTNFSLEFIEKNKDKLNFKEHNFIQIHRDIINIDFIKNNVNLFDPSHYSFYYLPLSIELINQFIDKVNWHSLSGCNRLDWNWDFINLHFDKFNFLQLSRNKGIYDKLIANNQSRSEVINFLNNQLANF